MKEKKPATESFDQWEAWAQRTYRTGGTQPPKSYGGLIAFLLVVIIFLCGISTALGLMNIRLFQQLNTTSLEPTSPISFSQGPSAKCADAPLGFTAQTVSTFWQNYHNLPPGVYVTEVTAGSSACKQDVQPGDVLVALDGIPVTDVETMQQLVSAYQPGDWLRATFIRQGQEIILDLMLEG